MENSQFTSTCIKVTKFDSEMPWKRKILQVGNFLFGIDLFFRLYVIRLLLSLLRRILLNLIFITCAERKNPCYVIRVS